MIKIEKEVVKIYNKTLSAEEIRGLYLETRTVTIDTTEPSFSNNKTNASLMKINGNATFNITVSDYGVGLSYYIFSWNGTGNWDNLSNGSISGSSVKLVINKSTNLSYGNTIGYRWYANDSLNQSFECEQVFFNEPLLAQDDIKHSQEEARYYVLGQTDKKRLLFVVFTIRNDLIRVISARDMSKKERKVYGSL